MRGATKIKVGVLVAAFGALAADRLLLGGGFGPASAIAESLSLGGSTTVDVQKLLAELSAASELRGAAAADEAPLAINDAFAASGRLLALLAPVRDEQPDRARTTHRVQLASIMFGRDPVATLDGEQRRVGDVLASGLVVVRIEQDRVILSDGRKMFSVVLGTAEVLPLD